MRMRRKGGEFEGLGLLRTFVGDPATAQWATVGEAPAPTLPAVECLTCVWGRPLRRTAVLWMCACTSQERGVPLHLAVCPVWLRMRMRGARACACAFLSAHSGRDRSTLAEVGGQLLPLVKVEQPVKGADQLDLLLAGLTEEALDEADKPGEVAGQVDD